MRERDRVARGPVVVRAPCHGGAGREGASNCGVRLCWGSGWWHWYGRRGWSTIRPSASARVAACLAGSSRRRAVYWRGPAEAGTGGLRASWRWRTGKTRWRPGPTSRGTLCGTCMRRRKVPHTRWMGTIRSVGPGVSKSMPLNGKAGIPGTDAPPGLVIGFGVCDPAVSRR